MPTYSRRPSGLWVLERLRNERGYLALSRGRAAAAAVPTASEILSVSPSTGAGGETLRINCTRLRATPTVTIGGNAATVTASSYGVGTPYPYVDVTLPAHADGAVDVVIADYHGSDTLTNGFTYAAAGGVPGDVVFRTAWITGTGAGDAAVRDTDQTLPWDTQSGNGTLNTVLAATGLDFPSTNVYKSIAEFSGTAFPGQTIYTDQLRITHTNSHWAIPGVGASLYYRWYQRYQVPDSVPAQGSATPHTVQDGPAAGSMNWMWETPVNDDGTWNPQFNFANANSYPNNRWRATALNKNQTYRIEFQFERTGTTTFLPHCRIYDSSNVLLLTDADFKNAAGGGSTTFATTSDLNIEDTAFLSGWQMGNNGPNWNVGAGDFPFDLWCHGAAIIRTADWNGPFISAEETP